MKRLIIVFMLVAPATMMQAQDSFGRVCDHQTEARIEIGVGVNFVVAVTTGCALGDIYQTHKRYDLKVYLESFEKYAERKRKEFPDIEEDSLIMEYKRLSELFDKFENRDFNIDETNFVYDKGYGTAVEKGRPKWQSMDESFIKPHTISPVCIAGSKELLIKGCKDSIATKHEVYKTKSGRWDMLANYYKYDNKNPLEVYWDGTLQTFIFREIHDIETGILCSHKRGIFLTAVLSFAIVGLLYMFFFKIKQP
jgi:hypothetical protein